MDLHQFKREFDPYLKRYCRQKRQTIKGLVGDRMIHSYLDHGFLLLQDGKRLRPYLVMLAYVAAGGKPSRRFFDFLVSLELFHGFCLIHDDVMDEGVMRHGVPTLQRYIMAQLASRAKLTQMSRLGQGQAILVGDLFFTWAHQRFALAEQLSPATYQEVLNCWNQMIEQVVAGQMLDLELSAQSSMASEQLFRMIELKTAGYSFIHPLQIGHLLGGGRQDEIYEFYATLGHRLGFAFQAQDDLLELLGGDFSDLQTQQQTYYRQYLLTHGSQEQRREFNALLGRSLTQEESHRALALLEQSGTLAATQNIIAKALATARQLIQEGPLNTSAQQQWLVLIDQLAARER